MEPTNNIGSASAPLRTQSRASAAIFSSAIVLLASVAQAETVDVSIGAWDGMTPRYIGYNIGRVDSEEAAWLEHSTINAARVWLKDKNRLYKQPPGPDEPVPQSSIQFIYQRQNARTEINLGPTGPNGDCNTSIKAALDAGWNPRWVSFRHYHDRLQDSGFLDTFANLYRLDITPLIQQTLARWSAYFPLSQNTSDPDYWMQRWELWRHVFAQAYYLGTEFNVTSWQIYNEPDYEDETISKADWLERQHLAADAVQLAIKTINKRRNACGQPTLTANVSAAALTHIGIYTGSKNDGISSPRPLHKTTEYFLDPSDPDVPNNDWSWGRFALQNRFVTRFYGLSLANADSFPSLFQSFDYHWYGNFNKSDLQGPRFDFANLGTYFQLFPDAAGNVPPTDVYLGEHNIRSTGATWQTAAGKEITPDDPEDYVDLARLLMNDARGDVGANPFASPTKNIILFKMTQDSGHRSGFYHVGAGNRVGGMTRGAEVVRLYAKAFTGSRYRYAIDSSSSSVETLGSWDGTSFYLMAVNPENLWHTLHFNLSNVSGLFHSAVIETLRPSDRGIAEHRTDLGDHLYHEMAPQSVVLIKLSLSRTLVTANAVGDAMVKSGSNSWTNYGTSRNLYAAGSNTSDARRNVSFIKFSVASSQLDRADWAVLDVFAQAKTTSGHVSAKRADAHVYGIVVEHDWDERSITWSSAPNLGSARGAMSGIADNYIEGIGESATFLGHISADGTARHVGVDVSDFVKRHTGSEITFLIAREYRFESSYATNSRTDNLDDDDVRSVWMASRQASSSSQRPKLYLGTF